MKSRNIRMLQQKISALKTNLSKLEVKRDEIIRRRCDVSGSERQKLIQEIVANFELTKQAQRRLHSAKHLLARAQGDEYEFRVS
jgi:multidrug resistance efflux pump